MRRMLSGKFLYIETVVGLVCAVRVAALIVLKSLDISHAAILADIGVGFVVVDIDAAILVVRTIVEIDV